MKNKKKERRQFRNRGRTLRYENMVQMSSVSSPTKRLADPSEFANQLQLTSNSINENIIKVRNIINKYDPIRLLLYSYGTTMHLIRGKMSEVEYGEEENMAFRLCEYIFNVIVSTPLNDSLVERVDEDEWKLLVSGFTDVFRETCSYFMLESMNNRTDDKESIEGDFIQFQEKMRWIGIRGDRYMLNDVKYLRRFLEPHDEIFKEIYGISVDELLQGFEKIQESLNYGIENAVSTIRAIHTQVLEYVEENNLPITSPEQLTGLVEVLGLKESADKAINDFINDSLYEVSAYSGLPDRLLRDLAFAPGEETEYFQGDNAGWLTKTTPNRKRPLLFINEKYYCFDLYSLSDDLYRLIQKTILQLKPEYKETWNRRQKLASEVSTLDEFERLLPGCQRFHEVYYQARTGSQQRLNWCELDGLVLFEGVLIAIENKAGSFSPDSPSEHFDTVVSSTQELLAKPSNQAQRFLEYLQSADVVQIFDEHHQPIRDLRKNEYDLVLGCSVTLDNIPSLAARAESLTVLGIDTIENWCLSLDDLTVYADIFRSPLTFLHFLAERVRAIHSPAIMMADELDHLGAYLKHINYVDYAEKAGTFNYMSWSGYHRVIDEYFAKSLKGMSADLPEPTVPNLAKEIVAFLDNGDLPNRKKLAFHILSLTSISTKDLDSEYSRWIDRQILLNKHTQLNLQGHTGLTLCTSLAEMPLPDAVKNWTRDYTCAVTLKTGELERLFLQLYLDANRKIIKIEHEFIKRAEALLRQEELAPYAEKYLTSTILSRQKKTGEKKIGRNDPCPCGSGKKYKKCCGAEI